MPNLFRIFGISKPAIPPTPPAQVNVIRSDIIHSMPAVETFGLTQVQFIHSDIIHTLHPYPPAAWIYGPHTYYPSLASITSGVSHA